MATGQYDVKLLAERADRVLMRTYARLPVAFVRGEGTRLWDTEGRSYLDFVSGLAVNSLGHAHPRLFEAIAEAARSLLHTSNHYHIPWQVELAEELVRRTGMDRAFFCNSGAEANEAAIKLARRYQKKAGRPEKIEIVTAENSFHGRTLATVTATGQPKYQAGFEPLPQGFRYVPLNDVAALERAIGPQTAAVMLEPIQGEGGIHPCTPEYLQAARRLTQAAGALLIFDEVQTGAGRTGRFLAAEHFGVKPDICTLAKGLGGGVPIGAALATEEAAQGFDPGSHASTFGGNPLACRAALAVLRAIDEEGLLERAREAGERLARGLDELARRHPGVIVERRGMGLMVGVELGVPGEPVRELALKRGLLVNVIGGRILRLLPPLTVADAEIDDALSILDRVFEECASESA